MKLSELSLGPGEKLDGAELERRFDRGMTGRGIEICYDEDDQRYLRLFSSETGPYADDVTGGQFTYIGEGRTGDQTLTAGNKYLANAIDAPLPIFFFHRGSGDDRWEYQGKVEVLRCEKGPFDSSDRDVFRFTLQRRRDAREQVDPVEAGADLASPERIESTRSRIIRNTQQALDLKEQYSYTCQVCGARRRRTVDQGYAEAHHLKPLGKPHEGPDVRANLLVLCPDHHADFDYGTIAVDPDTLTISHAYEQSLDGTTLHLREDHELDGTHLEYHNRNIAQF
ncbi:HNH endonuclease domain-containing protein [Haloferax elongans ATCC BAA-1513]|uniref:HNH endonuclease domain-containing protein n=1 Tax=Haloferax elongans ATCC BAA-1513 TaxID=1230453 RepID=M0HRD6_HALEO|nr:HNH endonuclease [Haloferax elongans]ELZ85679.1 HNH endonuclease domain-containing protein [Haloferax elongans ATCC BAA-1513]